MLQLQNHDLPATKFLSVLAMKYARKIVSYEIQLTAGVVVVDVVTLEEYYVFLVFQEVVKHHYYSC